MLGGYPQLEAQKRTLSQFRKPAPCPAAHPQYSQVWKCPSPPEIGRPEDGCTGLWHQPISQTCCTFELQCYVICDRVRKYKRCSFFKKYGKIQHSSNASGVRLKVHLFHWTSAVYSHIALTWTPYSYHIALCMLRAWHMRHSITIKVDMGFQCNQFYWHYKCQYIATNVAHCEKHANGQYTIMHRRYANGVYLSVYWKIQHSLNK